MADTVELDSQEIGDVIQTNEGNPEGQSTQTTNEETAKIEAEKLLQAEYTRTRQALIESTKRLVEKDGSELHDIQDPKLRDSVSRALFNMGYAEAEAVFGKWFTSAENKGDEPTSIDAVQKELRLLKYREEERNIDMAINKLRSESPQMFQWVSDMEEKIREELGNIVTSIPLDDRIRRAANNALGSALDSTSLAYKILNNKNSWIASGSTNKSNTKSNEENSTQQLLSTMMKGYMGIKSK